MSIDINKKIDNILNSPDPIIRHINTIHLIDEENSKESDISMTIKEIHSKLEKAGYISSPTIDYAVSGCIMDNVPLVIEGAPGVGKTELAKATAKMLNLPLYRVQFYEGLTYDKILYDYNYQKQLLTIQAIKGCLDEHLKDLSVEEAVKKVEDIPIFGKDFILERPVLKSINGEGRCVLLLDEIDKSSEEIEYTLLQFLDEFAITIPQYGTVTCPENMKPIVFLTSNNYRELSNALRRRCNYLYIEPKTKAEMEKILVAKAKIDSKLAQQVANCLDKIKGLPLKQTPSISEAITWARHIDQNFKENPNEIENTIYMIAKNNSDRIAISSSGIIKNIFS